jgi:RIO kinase 1
MLLRDVTNLADFFGQFAPELLSTSYGGEIWNLYERGELHAGSTLTGSFARPSGPVDLSAVLREVNDVRAEEAARLLRMAAR